MVQITSRRQHIDAVQAKAKAKALNRLGLCSSLALACRECQRLGLLRPHYYPSRRLTFRCQLIARSRSWKLSCSDRFKMVDTR
jgi:hypothetical protein